MQNLTKLGSLFCPHYSYSEPDPSKVPVSQHQVLPSKQSKLRAIPKYFLKFYCPIGQDIIAKHYVNTAAIIRS